MFGDGAGRRALEYLGSGDALFFQRREAAREDRLADERYRLAGIECADHGPLAGSLLSRGVENLVYQRLTILVLLGEDVA